MTHRVLIAEDEPSIVLSLEFLMREAGLEVLTVDNGADALRICHEQVPDLLLLDVMLPLANGFEVCRTVRSDLRLRSMRIVMLTARGREHEVEHGLALGADAYVTKPFATRELMAIVRKLLDAPPAAQ